MYVLSHNGRYLGPRDAAHRVEGLRDAKFFLSAADAVDYALDNAIMPVKVSQIGVIKDYTDEEALKAAYEGRHKQIRQKYSIHSTVQ